MSEMTRENAREIRIIGNLDDYVNELLKYQMSGESVFINYYGHKLYSCDVTMDSAYKQVTGKTRDEYYKDREEWLEESKEKELKEREAAKEKIPHWIEKGKEYIYPERMEEWKKFVEYRVNGEYNGSDLESALEVMKKLESGASMEEAKEVFDQKVSLSHIYAAYVKRIIFEFSKKGPEFYENTSDRELSEEEKIILENKKRENAELQERHKKDFAKEIDEQQRIEEEKEIVDLSSEKAKLISEIGDVEQQLEGLSEQGAELKKESKSNEINEK